MRCGSGSGWSLWQSNSNHSRAWPAWPLTWLQALWVAMATFMRGFQKKGSIGGDEEDAGGLEDRRHRLAHGQAQALDARVGDHGGEHVVTTRQVQRDRKST